MLLSLDEKSPGCPSWWPGWPCHRGSATDPPWWLLWLWEWPRSHWWPRVDIPLLSCAHCRAHSGLRPIEGRKSFFFVMASPCHVSWLFSGGVRMIPGKMGQSSGGGAEEVTVFRYWVGMSDFSGKSGRNWKCLCHVCAVLQPH